MSLPSITVIVPVRHGGALIPEFLACMAGVDYPRDRLEILLVDCGGRNLFPTAAAQTGLPPFRVVTSPAGASFAGRNAGVAAAAGELLAFTDIDCLPRADWLRQGAAALMAGAEVVWGAVHPWNPAGVYGVADLYEEQVSFHSSAGTRGVGCFTANLFTTRQVMAKCGGFPDMRSGGDYAWSRRMQRAGMAVAWRDDVVVGHRNRDWRGLVAKQRRITGGILEALIRERVDRRHQAGRLVRALFLPPLPAMRRLAGAARAPWRLRCGAMGLLVVAKLAGWAAFADLAAGRLKPGSPH